MLPKLIAKLIAKLIDSENLKGKYMKGKENMVTVYNDLDLIENKKLRDELRDRVDVLDRVKQVFLIPGVDLLPMRQVAEFYNAEFDAVRQCYLRNKVEIDQDGVIMLKPSDLAEKIQMRQDVTLDFGSSAKVNYGGYSISISNRGTYMFSKRAVLRVGMLLRDSVIAREVRTQLLNTYEHATSEQRVSEIDKEEGLINQVGKAVFSGNRQKIGEAIAAVDEFYKQNIAKAEEEVKRLKEENALLDSENSIMAKKVMTRDAGKLILALIRSFAAQKFSYKVPIGERCRIAFDYYAREMNYKGINLKSRMQKSGLSSIKCIMDSELDVALRTAIALCRDYNVDLAKALSPTQMGQIIEAEALC